MRKVAPYMPLNDVAVRNAKPGAKAIKLFDERGLYLEISPAGGKWWRLKYRFGKEKRMSLGTYPDTSLKDARAARDGARKLIAGGVDPSAHRKATKGAAQRAQPTVLGKIWKKKRLSVEQIVGVLKQAQVVFLWLR